MPIIKRWDRIWYTIRIIGTIILIGIWIITRNSDNPITGRSRPISEMAIAIEVFQIAYTSWITAIIIVREKVGKPGQPVNFIFSKTKINVK